MKTIGLVDFSHTLRVNYHVRPADGSPTQAGEYTLQQLSDWRRGLDHVIVCLDSPPYDRSTAYPEYKAGRARDDGYIQVCRWTKERLVKDGYSIASHPGAEADDVIATLANKLLEDHEAQDVRIFGADKDCLQCVCEWKSGITARMFVPAARGDFEIRDYAWVKEKWGITPEQVPLFLAICGDKGDNIPGCRGIGPKGAADLINEYGTIAAMRIAAVAALEESQKEGAKPLAARWKHFLAGSPRLPEWLALTTLRTDLPLDVDALLVKQKPQPLVVESADDIEHGDAWEPSAEELAEERAMLDPEVVISGPKAVPGTARPLDATATSADAIATHAVSGDTYGRRTSASSDTAQASNGEANSPKAEGRAARNGVPLAINVAGPAESTPPARAPSTPPSNGTAPAAKPAPRSDEPASIVVARPPAPNWALQLQPTTVAETVRLCALLFNSRFLSQFGSERGVTAIVLMGRELGIGAMASLEMFHIVKDRPFPKAKGLRYLAERDPNCEWIQVVEADDEHATVQTKHKKAGLLTYTYTIERARRAGYLTGVNKHNWATITQEMLEARATSKAVNRWYSGATFGMPSAEEMQDREEQEDE